VTEAGFVDFAIESRADVYAAAEQSGSAANFGTLGITFRARKAASVRNGAKRLQQGTRSEQLRAPRSAPQRWQS
jgi:hypothetical protein